MKYKLPNGPISWLYEITVHVSLGWNAFDIAVVTEMPFGGHQIVDSLSKTHESGTTEHQSSPITTYHI